ncbi:MAG: hypothetical protein Q7K34_02035 [archaeon]|nr:hypothetical protein [archaeon]
MKPLFKALVFLFFFSLPVFFVSAEVSLFEPVETRVFDGDSVELGSAAFGETFRIIASTESGFEGITWDSLSAQALGAASIWAFESGHENAKRIFLQVTLPKEMKEGIYEFEVSASNSALSFTESFTARLEVRRKLVKIAVSESEPSSPVTVNGVKKYRLTFTNPSIAPESLEVGSSLPLDWFSGKTLVVPSKKTVEETVEVRPLVHGKKDFSLQVVSGQSGDTVSSFGLAVESTPTFAGKFSSVASGFPFFAPTLFSAYFFTGFVGSFFS